MDEFDLFAVKSKKANKTNSSFCFLGESMVRQSAFKINWPLAITPKSEDKYVVKVLNSTELHYSEVYFFQNWYFSAHLYLSIPFKIAMYLNNFHKSRISISNRLIAKPLCKFVNFMVKSKIPSLIHKIVLKGFLLRTKITLST